MDESNYEMSITLEDGSFVGSSLEMPPEQSLALICTVHGYESSHKLLWYEEGRVLNHQSTIEGGAFMQQQQLSLTNLSADDCDRKLTCIYGDGDQVEVAKSTTIKCPGKGLSITLENGTSVNSIVNIIPGQRLSLICTIHGYELEHDLVWYQGGRVLGNQSTTHKDAFMQQQELFFTKLHARDCGREMTCMNGGKDQLKIILMCPSSQASAAPPPQSEVTTSLVEPHRFLGYTTFLVVFLILMLLCATLTTFKSLRSDLKVRITRIRKHAMSFWRNLNFGTRRSGSTALDPSESEGFIV
ncbi:transmembrane and immunoglobulin domain-containing protein 1 isoform X2 [Hyalella azteca]|uniref:Transmembrane and immunoglobulin domain-containing protein 1 isoform X2 n=1 Tax=Hyalella azteca TaxID=294128 RepID=A0A979FRV1_HYAAZ|nr:transmembrane and immunoglobulin domain-containing protein 1 isoform X2 [Hyalella azteca]